VNLQHYNYLIKYRQCVLSENSGYHELQSIMYLWYMLCIYFQLISQYTQDIH